MVKKYNAAKMSKSAPTTSKKGRKKNKGRSKTRVF